MLASTWKSIHVPSEAPDELAVYLPDSGVLIDTEVIQGPTFPNVYTLRGTKFRQPMVWVRSIDRLRRLKAAYLVPTHGRPVEGEAKVDIRLTGNMDDLKRFLAYFETPGADPISLTLH